MFFKRKKTEAKPLCFHTWQVSDFSTEVSISLDTDEIYTLGCPKCGRVRNVDDYEYGVMLRKGFIKEAADE